MVESVDAERKTLVSYDEREVPFDLLVTIPLNMGAEFVARSGLGDELNFVPVDKHTFLSTKYDNIFALGDASDIPASKAGSVAHFAVDIFSHNFLQHIDGAAHGREASTATPTASSSPAMARECSSTSTTTPSRWPARTRSRASGRSSLLKPTHANHWGKLMFRWIYWNVLLPGRHIPLPAQMSMAGKKIPAGA